MVKSSSVSDLATLQAKSFQVVFRGHAKAILGADFAQALLELEGILLGLTIPIEEIIASGGGETKGTQRLRRLTSLYRINLARPRRIGENSWTVSAVASETRARCC